jgi:hypothetical protein
MHPVNEPGVESVLAKMGSEHDGRATRRNRASPVYCVRRLGSRRRRRAVRRPRINGNFLRA